MPKTPSPDFPVGSLVRYVKQGIFITAGNASQLSDGAATVLLMEWREAERRGLTPLGAYPLTRDRSLHSFAVVQDQMIWASGASTETMHGHTSGGRPQNAVYDGKS
jgi:hypothetical protein